MLGMIGRIRLNVADVVIGTAALLALLPVTGALAGLAGGTHLSDAVWFLINLGGPLIVIGSGIYGFVLHIKKALFTLAYTLLVTAGGLINLKVTGFDRLMLGWSLCAIAVGALMLAVKSRRACTITGVVWSLCLLGMWCYGGVVSSLRHGSTAFVMRTALLIASLLAMLMLMLVHLRQDRFAGQT